MATMADHIERKLGMARVLCDEFKINDREIEAAVVKGLTGEGFDVEIEPEIRPGTILGPDQTPGGSTIKVYRKVGNYA